MSSGQPAPARPRFPAQASTPNRTGGSGTYPASSSPGSAGTAAEGARKRILIVEDDEQTRRFLALTLRRQYEVIEAQDGVEGLELAMATPAPDLILTDVMMPRLDGLGMVKELKRRAPDRKVPVIFLTAKGGAADVAAAIGAGARQYLVKPVKLQTLEDAVKGALKK